MMSNFRFIEKNIDVSNILADIKPEDEVKGWRDRTEEEQLADIEMLRERRIERE